MLASPSCAFSVLEICALYPHACSRTRRAKRRKSLERSTSAYKSREEVTLLRRADTVTDLQGSLVGTDVRAAAAELKCSICMLKHAVLCLNATANDRDGLSSIVQIVAGPTRPVIIP